MRLELPRSVERGLSHAGYAAEAHRLKPGHRLSVLVDGAEAYPAMLAAISQARRWIHLETYIFEYDAIGQRFVAALIERARAGVEVRILVDAVGSFGFDDAAGGELAAAGVQLRVYAPLGHRWSIRRWLRRDHRKILVVDGEIGFVGGLNIGLEYAPVLVGGGGWRDTHLEVCGPAVAELESMFRATWDTAGGSPYPHRAREADESVAVPGSEWAFALGADHGGRRSEIRRHIMHALRKATERAWVASGYFVPDRAMRRAFIAAVARGVDVRVLVPAESDLKSVQWGGEFTYAALLRGGVRLFQWTQTHMHAKTMMVDSVWSMVGSYNLDYVSLFRNQEVVVVAVGEATGERLQALFEADLAQSVEVTLDTWLARPWWERTLAWLFYRIRRFL